MAQDATVVQISNLPTVTRDANGSEWLRRSPHWVKSDAVAFDDTTAINLFEIPGNCLVTDVVVRVTTAFDASGTSALSSANITVPNDTGTETVISLADLTATGFFPSTMMAVTPSSGGYVIMNYTANTTTAGGLEVYMSYVQYEDQL